MRNYESNGQDTLIPVQIKKTRNLRILDETWTIRLDSVKGTSPNRTGKFTVKNRCDSTRCWIPLGFMDAWYWEIPGWQVQMTMKEITGSYAKRTAWLRVLIREAVPDSVRRRVP